LLKPLVVSWGYDADIPGPSKFIDHHEWTGTRDISAFLSVPNAIEFQQEHDWGKIRLLCHEMVSEVQTRISTLSGLSPLANKSWNMQFSAIPLPQPTNLVELKTRLYDEYRIEVPLIMWNGRKLIRVSIQGYNTERDIDKLMRALGKLEVFRNKKIIIAQ